MDSLVMILKLLLASSLFRVFLIAWVAFFLFIVVLSIHTATVPDRRLYKAGADGAKRASLSAIRNSYRSNPEKWLLYEEEIFYVKDPDELDEEQQAAYKLAQARCVNGGSEARRVGMRVRVRRGEARAYLRFFYGLHKERARAPKAARG